jgi:myo-inositol-1(or 4)-monophosphatase
MKEIPLSHLLDTAICAAEAAGNHALANKDRRMESNETPDHDIKLVLDVECQAIAEKMIASEFPEHGILGEEGSQENLSSEYEWIIDPIDGTVNYSHGFPYWCASVAVRRNGKILAGCVFAPESNQYYTAHAEAPAKLNGEPIHVSETRFLRDAMVASEIPKQVRSASDPRFETFKTLTLAVQKIRINGSAAIDLCRVADGSLDGFLQTGIYLWDHAAAGLIAERAGATTLVFPHPEETYGAGVLCANKNLIDGLRAIHSQHH